VLGATDGIEDVFPTKQDNRTPMLQGSGGAKILVEPRRDIHHTNIDKIRKNNTHNYMIFLKFILK
jgi:hypothetical protein